MSVRTQASRPSVACDSAAVDGSHGPLQGRVIVRSMLGCRVPGRDVRWVLDRASMACADATGRDACVCIDGHKSRGGTVMVHRSTLIYGHGALNQSIPQDGDVRHRKTKSGTAAPVRACRPMIGAGGDPGSRRPPRRRRHQAACTLARGDERFAAMDGVTSLPTDVELLRESLRAEALQALQAVELRADERQDAPRSRSFSATRHLRRRRARA